jgi:uncharacterized membrane protein
LRLEVSHFVKAQPEKVYAAYTDFEAMPKWSKHLTAVRITKREGDTVFLEKEGVSSRGRRRKTGGMVRLLPPDRVESESETRFTRTKGTVAFEKVPEGEGTKVTATLDVQVKGLWAMVLSTRVGKDDAESSALEELASFARFVEGPPQ